MTTKEKHTHCILHKKNHIYTNAHRSSRWGVTYFHHWSMLFCSIECVEREKNDNYFCPYFACFSPFTTILICDYCSYSSAIWGCTLIIKVDIWANKEKYSMILLCFFFSSWLEDCRKEVMNLIFNDRCQPRKLMISTRGKCFDKLSLKIKFNDLIKIRKR